MKIRFKFEMNHNDINIKNAKHVLQETEEILRIHLKCKGGKYKLIAYLIGVFFFH